ncbi:MAG: hypothetical protein ACP5VQ_08335 [Phycisphaerae bacterium]
MAIVVQCYHCHSRLELDDGFRGGICRCSKCGSLLKVPATAAADDSARTRPADPGTRSVGNRPSVPNEDPGFSSSGFRSQSGQRPAVPPSSGSGAFSSSSSTRSATPRQPETLADGQSGFPQSPVVTQKIPPAHQHPSAALVEPAKKKQLPRRGLIGFIILFGAATLIIAIIILAHQYTASSVTPPGSNGESPALDTGFLGIPLVGKSIIFSLDGSSANLDSFNLVAAYVKQAVKKLRPDQRIKFAIWGPNGLNIMPKKGWMKPRQAGSAEKTLLNYSPYGSTTAAAAMKETLKLGGDQIIFVTAKVFISNPDLAPDVLRVKKATQRIDVISVNGERKELQTLAQRSGGEFRLVTVSDLQNSLGE